LDLELKKSVQVFYDMSARRTVVHEQTCEAIVSDSQPDILRIASVSGAVFCAPPSESARGAEMRGTVRAAVTYHPETGTDICCIPVAMDFFCPIELADGSGGLSGSAELVSIDARTVNPRKVLLRAELKLCAQRIERVSLEMCSDIISEPAHSLELLRESRTARVLCAAPTRSFSLEDAVDIPAGAPAARELLLTRVSLTAGDCNIIGRRMIFKGTLSTELMYRTVSGDIATYAAALPFSQIAESEDLEDGAECVIRISPRSAEATLVQNGEGRTVELSVSADAQVLAFAERKIEAVTDLYSTSMQAAADIRPCSMGTLHARAERRARVHDSFETPQPVRETRSVDFDIRPLSFVRDEAGAAFRGDAEARVTYIDESGELCQLRRRIPVSVSADGLDITPEHGDTAIIFAHAENIAASASASGGAELRADIVCDVLHMRSLTLGTVTSAELTELPADAPARPSVVLKRPETGETLWQTAKRYCASVSELAAANGIENTDPLSCPPSGKMLLIPRRR